MHDHWLAVCAAALGEVRVIDEVLQDYVQHDGNVLGETGPTTVRAELRAARDHGGIRAHLDHAARERWAWRVAMARGLVERGMDTVDDAIADIANGRVTVRVAGRVGHGVARRRLRARGAAGTLLAAAWARRAAGP